MVFIDMEKAYDKIHREVLLRQRCLDFRGVHVTQIRAIKDKVQWS